MLPGLRFLMLATVLTCALLVFGLGAAAFLRATHDRFATTSPWQAPREVVFAGQPRDADATLSLLRIDTPPDTTEVAAGAAPAPAVVEPSPQATPAAAAQPPPPDERAIAALFPPAPAPVERDATADVLAVLASATPPPAVPDTPPPPTAIIPEPEPSAVPAIEPEPRAAETPIPDNETPAPQQTAALTPPEPAEPQQAEMTASVPPADPASAGIATEYGEEFAVEPIAHPPLPRPRPAMTRAARQNLAAAKRAREMEAAQRRQAAMRTRAPQQKPQQQPAYLFPSLFGN